MSTVGNSVTALKKNYAILALINDSSSASNYFSEDEDEDDDDEDEQGKEFAFGTNHHLSNNHSNSNNDDEVDDDAGVSARRRRRGAHEATSCGGGGGGGSGRIELGMHQKVKLLRRIGEGNIGNSSRRAATEETWSGVMVGTNGQCRHKVAIKKVAMVGEEVDVVWMQGKLEGLRRASMWCRNVCAFHGATRMEDGSLGLVMDRCRGSVQTEMHRNEGRLTLEQILRYSLIICLMEC